MSLLSQKTETVTEKVESYQDLVRIKVEDDHFQALYQKSVKREDGTVLDAGSFAVDRSVEAMGQEMLDWISVGVQLAQKYRQADLALAADAAAAQALP